MASSPEDLPYVYDASSWRLAIASRAGRCAGARACASREDVLLVLWRVSEFVALDLRPWPGILRRKRGIVDAWRSEVVGLQGDEMVRLRWMVASLRA